jgi:nitrate reductase gamma subunit
VILAFVGALHWGFAIAGRLPATSAVIMAAILPSVLGAAAMLLDGQRGLALLIAGFGLFGIYEHRRWADSLPADYLAMRRRLTLAVCASLTLALFASETAGLR